MHLRCTREDENEPLCVIPGEQCETRNPGAKNWIPAFTGMTDRDAPLISISTPSARTMSDSQG